MMQKAEKELKERQQLLQDDNSVDDESMGGMSHIPADSGVNNSDLESAAMDEVDDDKDDGDNEESYHTRIEWIKRIYPKAIIWKQMKMKKVVVKMKVSTKIATTAWRVQPKRI